MVRVALCQANLSVGDIDGNIERIRERISSASELGGIGAKTPIRRVHKR